MSQKSVGNRPYKEHQSEPTYDKALQRIQLAESVEVTLNHSRTGDQYRVIDPGTGEILSAMSVSMAKELAALETETTDPLIKKILEFHHAS